MAKEPKIIRQWSILRSLSARRLVGATLDEMATDAGVNRRTIQRDISELQALRFPIIEQTAEGGLKRFRLDSDDGLINLKFTLEEAAALALGRQFLEPLAGTYFHAGAISALKKIRSTLGDSALRHIEHLAHGFYHAVRGWSDYSNKAELIDSLVRAIEDRKITAIGYHGLRSTEEVSHYDLYPLSLVYWRGALYLIADSPGHKKDGASKSALKNGDGLTQSAKTPSRSSAPQVPVPLFQQSAKSIRTFKVDRIESAQVLQLPFDQKIDFDANEFLKNSFGIFQSDAEPQTVRVAFRGDVGRLLEERQFHPSQKLKRQRDGRWLAEFELSSFEEFLSWILSWGATAEVLEPADLRAQAATALGEALKAYEGSTAQNSAKKARLMKEP